jgi:hypothetical protein
LDCPESAGSIIAMSGRKQHDLPDRHYDIASLDPQDE